MWKSTSASGAPDNSSLVISLVAILTPARFGERLDDSARTRRKILISVVDLRVDLWLAFSVVAFFANFVPNLGAIVAVALPMPVVLIDPDGSPFHSGMAFFSLVLMHALVGNVVEPVFFGHSCACTRWWCCSR